MLAQRASVLAWGTLHIAATLTVAAAQAQIAPPEAIAIRVLSSRPDMVTGGHALVEIRPVDLASLTVSINGKPIDAGAFSRGASERSATGLVEGLTDGLNVVTASAGGREASLTLTNHPITGPVVSGPHMAPFVCTTQQAGLGDPLDAHCSAATKVEYFFKSRGAAGEFRPLPDPTALPADVGQTMTRDGRQAPYVVRVESGTIGRAIYRIAILDDPRQTSPPQTWKPGPAWNGRLVYSFGGGCGTNYTQGRSSAQDVLSDLFLSRGYAHITSSANVLGQYCNDALSGEVVMMVKEHFIERYGVPVWTVGSGGSGGAMQQFLIAQNLPGLLDGLMPTRSFPDLLSMWNDFADCRLLTTYFTGNPGAWTQTKRDAVEGFSRGTCLSSDNYMGTIVASNARGCGISPELVYDPQRHPHGARCTIWDTNVNTYGRDPSTGAARRTLDNVGVQYGLKGLNDGVISPSEFLDLNLKIGGYDNDGNLRQQRTVADPEAVRLAFAAGRINSGAGALGSIPIINFRAYLDDRSNVHDRVRDFIIRHRLERAYGRSEMFVTWLAPAGPMLDVLETLTLETMSQWLDAIARDASSDPAGIKAARARPPRAVDACWDHDATRIDEPLVYGRSATRCNTIFPVHATPRIAAGGPLAADVLKCQLKPLARSDYTVTFTDAEWQQMSQAFPTGVCDYSKPSVNAVPVQGVYQRLPLAPPQATASASRR